MERTGPPCAPRLGEDESPGGARNQHYWNDAKFTTNHRCLFLEIEEPLALAHLPKCQGTQMRIGASLP